MTGFTSGDPDLDALLADEEDEELQMAVALSISASLPPTRFTEDPKEVERAISQSLELATVEEKQRSLQKRKEDPELLEAALRASLIDLGPKGVSQAAKIMDTGDDTLGHARLLKRMGTHKGAGAPFQRSMEQIVAPLTPSPYASSSATVATVTPTEQNALTSPSKPTEENALMSPSGGRAAAASVVCRSNARAGSKSSTLLQTQRGQVGGSHAVSQDATSRPGSRAGSKSLVGTRSQLQDAGRALTTSARLQASPIKGGNSEQRDVEGASARRRTSASSGTLCR
mmetsp:Transcript_29431/g.67784  ORF Transcript_29431/g.67784 Transcript_29431/m.67784 type:complete len:285 (-) Transcript_29431:100-954(-)